MAKKIMSAINSNSRKRISAKNLQSIIGSKPTYPIQEVGSLKLKKCFMASEYELA